jgi:hypothetical protein
MATLISAYVTIEKLELIVKSLKAKSGKDAKGFKMTIAVNDESNDFGQNVSIYAEQTKEQRDAKTPKFYAGNGKVFWTDGKISIAEKSEPSNSEPSVNHDAPF